jgi:hypothetical protein
LQKPDYNPHQYNGQDRCPDAQERLAQSDLNECIEKTRKNAARTFIVIHDGLFSGEHHNMVKK